MRLFTRQIWDILKICFSEKSVNLQLICKNCVGKEFCVILVIGPHDHEVMGSIPALSIVILFWTNRLNFMLFIVCVKSIIDNIITEKTIGQKIVPDAALMGVFASIPGAA